MAEDIVRVIRIIEYVGSRSDVEEQLAHSMHGTRKFPRPGKHDMEIRVATIGEFPEILERALALEPESTAPEGCGNA
jgi:hypothetical protein